jgi:hypothetical protein
MPLGAKMFQESHITVQRKMTVSKPSSTEIQSGISRKGNLCIAPGDRQGVDGGSPIREITLEQHPHHSVALIDLHI